MSAVYLDSHAAVFLHDGLIEEFSVEARRQLEANDLLISPGVLLEFDYLFQRRKIAIGARALFATLNASHGIELCDFPFAGVANEAPDIRWTTDPLDRLIVPTRGRIKLRH